MAGTATLSGRRASWPHARLSAAARDRLLGAGMLLPACLVVFGLCLYPLIYTLWLSLTKADEAGPGAFIGLANFRTLAADPSFWTAARNTVVVGGITLVLEVIFGLATALLLWWRFPGRALLFIAVFIPWVYPAAFSSFAWFWIFTPPFHTFYSVDAVHVKQWVDNVLGPGWWSFSSIITVNVWRCSSFIAIFVLAALNGIPSELLEYARIETKSAVQRLRLVILPLIWPFLVLAVLLSLVVTYIDFTNVYIQSGGRFYEPLLLTQSYSLSILHGMTGLGAAIDIVQLPVIALILAVGFAIIDRQPQLALAEASEAPHARQSPQQPRPRLGKAPQASAHPRLRRRLLAGVGILAALLVAVFHIFPIYWTVIQAIRPLGEDPAGNSLWAVHPSFDAFREVIERAEFWIWMRNTAVIFGSTLLLTLALSLLAGYALARFRVPGGRWLARLLFASYFIPQTAIVVPVYRLFLTLGIVDTQLCVVLLYLTLTLPFCVWLLFIYFRGLPADLEENALLDGSRLAVFRHVVLRMSWPVLVAAGVFSLGVMSTDLLYANTFLIHNGQQTVVQGLGVLEIDLDEFNNLTGGLGLGALPIVAIAAAFAPSYVRGLTTAMVEGA